MADENKKEFHHHNQKETHGLRDDINEETPINEVKGPNVFERAKEEIEAIVEAIHHPKKETKIEKDDSLVSLGIERDSARNQELKPESPDSHSEKNCKSPKSHNFLEKAKEEIEALIHHKKKSHHHKETHGTSDDIDENTSISEVKGPGMFQRAKEEMEAIIGAIHPKKDSDDNEGISKKKNKEEGGFRKSIGRGLEKVCSPGSHNRD
ncbi:hypothetical protein M9H77_14717 [Catharanthus roseus]|uniref:Uncharacterized protein n=1 Tax=Catharanthus roseus TaxID=4058 RepID=A0ACC0BP33_CATRO|nr:hypothetical protein M9H77_14717 [Catharanthus roseus]